MEHRQSPAKIFINVLFLVCLLLAGVGAATMAVGYFGYIFFDFRGALVMEFFKYGITSLLIGVFGASATVKLDGLVR